MIEVPIETEVSEYIEKLFYEQNAVQIVMQNLINQNASAELIDKQVERYSKIYAELESAKRVAAQKYTPKPFSELNYYNFNFNNHSIEFYPLNEK